MSQRAKTPSPQQDTPAVPTSTPIALPATPGGATNDDIVPLTPGGRSATVPPKTPGPSISRASTLPPLNTPGGRAVPHPPSTPGGSFRGCTSDPTAFAIVKVHTAKCTECDKRNRDTMLRCPGCTFQICKPCRDKREKINRGLAHGNMLSPGGLGLRGGLLGRSGSGSGGVTRRKVFGLMGSPARDIKQEDGATDGDAQMANAGSSSPAAAVEGKGKEKATPTPKAAGKKRAAKSKPKPILWEESSDDDFIPDLASPTANKRRCTDLTLTDTPTATSARPSRTAPTSATMPTYVAPSSPCSDSSVDLEASVGPRPIALNAVELKKTWDTDVQDPAPKGRIQELLEENGVNTPGNRNNPAPSIQEQLDAQNKTERNEATRLKEARPITVRGFSGDEAVKYQSQHLSADENEELQSAIKEVARKWAIRTYDTLPHDVRATIVRSLDMRLDFLHDSYTAHLSEVIEGRAVRKLKEFEQDRGSSFVAPKPARLDGPANRTNSASERRFD